MTAEQKAEWGKSWVHEVLAELELEYMSTKKIARVAVASIFLVIIIAVISANPDAPLTLTDEEPVIEEPKYYLTLPADTLRFESHKIARRELVPCWANEE